MKRKTNIKIHLITKPNGHLLSNAFKNKSKMQSKVNKGQKIANANGLLKTNKVKSSL